MKSAERKFLHDIATPLATAIFILDTLKEDLLASNGKDSPLIQMTEELEKALNKTRDLLAERREILISQENKEE